MQSEALSGSLAGRLGALTVSFSKSDAAPPRATMTWSSSGTPTTSHARATDVRRADGRLCAIRQQHHFVELDRIPGSRVELLELDHFTFGDPMLLATAFENRKHTPLLRSPADSRVESPA